MVLSLASTSKRASFALAIMLLALRLLGPAGFMPAFDHGAVTIVMCPDADQVAPAMARHHGGHSKKYHQPCPYASASAPGSATAELPLLTGMLAVGLALLVGRPFVFLEPRRRHERPPLRGPPLTA